LIIEKSERFKDELEVIIDFVALDSVNKALDFYDAIISKKNKIIILGIFNQNIWE
jgi:hypothetical protein